MIMVVVVVVASAAAESVQLQADLAVEGRSEIVTGCRESPKLKEVMKPAACLADGSLLGETGAWEMFLIVELPRAPKRVHLPNSSYRPAPRLPPLLLFPLLHERKKMYGERVLLSALLRAQGFVVHLAVRSKRLVEARQWRTERR